MTTLSVVDLQVTLLNALPTALHAQVPQFIQSISNVARGTLSPDDFNDHCATHPNFVALLRVLYGKQILMDGLAISIRESNGHIEISFDEIIDTDSGDYAEGNIDKRQGVFISDSASVVGTVIGVNQGTVVIHPQPEIEAPPEPTRPPQVVDFVGREAELTYYTEKLASIHLATITGMAGVGKTALAATLARQIADPEKIFWHSFHQSEGIDTITWKLAGFLAWHGQSDLWRKLYNSKQSSGQVLPPEILFDYLFQTIRGRDYLLCFDDFHFVDADPLVDHLARRLRSEVLAGNVALVITSRSMPSFVQETEFALLKGLSRDDTHSLLTERKVLLTADQEAALYVHTEGNAQFLMLAIDALQQSNNPAHMIERLAETTDIERYLLNEVDASLNKDERAVMSAVSVFSGYSSTRDAIEAVLDVSSIRRILSDLNERHLLVVNESTLGREYVQHALVQSFYYDLLHKRERKTLHYRAGEYYRTEEPDILRSARHFVWAAEYAQAAELITADVWILINQGQASSLSLFLNQFTPEQLDSKQWAEICTAHAEVSILLGDFAEACSWLEEALEYGVTCETSSVQSESQAHRHRLLALVHTRVGEYDQAEAECRKGLELVASLGVPNLETARLHAQLAEVLWRRSQFDDAEQECQVGLTALPPEPAAPRERVLLLQRLATINGSRGCYTEAIEQLEQCLEVAQLTDDPILISVILNNLGMYLNNVGYSDRALACYAESLKLKEFIGDVAGQVYTMINQGVIYQIHGNYSSALDRFKEALRLSRYINLFELQARITGNIGIIRFIQGELDQAAGLFEDARASYDELGNSCSVADCLYRLGDVALGKGNVSEARNYGEQALALARQISSEAFESCALRVIGETFLMQGKIEEAVTYLEQAWQLQERVGDFYDQTLILGALAKLAMVQGDRAKARAHVRHGLGLAYEQRLQYQITMLERLGTEIGEGEITHDSHDSL